VISESGSLSGTNPSQIASPQCANSESSFASLQAVARDSSAAFGIPPPWEPLPPFPIRKLSDLVAGFASTPNAVLSNECRKSWRLSKFQLTFRMVFTILRHPQK
jgi:hypothetical protein